jgi:MoxR-like ATPase
MAKLACGCELDAQHEIPTQADLEVISEQTKILRGYANTHCIAPSGERAEGFSKWRNGASRAELLSALAAHRDKEYVLPKDGAPAALKAYGSIDKLPQLINQVEALLATINPEQLEQFIQHAAEQQLQKFAKLVQRIEIKDVSGEVKETTVQHRDFKSLLRLLQSGVHVMLVGPAGSGKTEAALAAARILKLEVEMISVGPQTMQSELAGYRNAHGEYITSAVRRAFEHGKCLIIDEMDSGNASVFTFINATLSNALAGYPDGIAKRHPNFRVIGCANTYGTGADMVYVGRSQLDGATLDRYAVWPWEYDTEFELALALQHNTEASGWVGKVQNWRTNMLKHKIRHIISPRASINGARLLTVGFSEDECARMLVFKGLNKEQVEKIKGEVK